MPTGYTVHIQNGDITTGKDFLKLCTRSFGIAMDIRDEPLSVPTPTHFEPDPLYKKLYDKAVEKRNKYIKMDFYEYKQKMIDDYKNKIQSAKEALDKYISEDEKYTKIVEEIKAWIPPTPEHEDLKKFALNQIFISFNTSIIDYYKEALNEKLDVSDEAVLAYMDDINKDCEKNVVRAYERWQDELKRVEGKNRWMQQFLDSLETMDGE